MHSPSVPTICEVVHIGSGPGTPPLCIYVGASRQLLSRGSGEYRYPRRSPAMYAVERHGQAKRPSYKTHTQALDPDSTLAGAETQHVGLTVGPTHPAVYDYVVIPWTGKRLVNLSHCS